MENNIGDIEVGAELVALGELVLGNAFYQDYSALVSKYQAAAEGLNPSRFDERHICPLQLEVIRRGVELWTNPGDIVLSPFAGIGSEGYVSLQMGRKFVGAELKASYYQQAARNLERAHCGTADLLATAQ